MAFLAKSSNSVRAAAQHGMVSCHAWGGTVTVPPGMVQVGIHPGIQSRFGQASRAGA